MPKKLLLMILLVGAVAFTTTACGDKNDDTPEWEWPDPTPTPTPKPDEDVIKPRFVWIDAASNFHDYANDKAKIESDMAKVAQVGFTDIVVDVRPTCGDVLFRTTHTEQATKLASWAGGNGYHWEERTAEWDYLDAFIEAGHKVGLRVHAGFNTMVAGVNNSLGQLGMAFRDAKYRSWVTVLNTANGLESAMYASSGTKFLNPANDEAMEFLCDLLKDLAAYKDLDGIVLDRCRYDNFMSDFSDVTRTKFEQYIGKTITNWPADVMTPGNETLPAKLSDVQYKWLEFRVKTIHDFMAKASAAVKSVNPEISFGAYVGGWYTTYYEVGVNWASPRFSVVNTYPKWATVDYKNYGYADHLDLLIIGAYASVTNLYGNNEWSVEGFCKQAYNKVMRECTVVGGPDVGNGTGWESGGKDAEVVKSVDAAINACDGYFIFDLVHVKKYDYWNALERGIGQYLRSVEK